MCRLGGPPGQVWEALHYSMMYCSINSASSVFTMKIPKSKSALYTRMMHLNNRT